jgi:chromosome segregation ATPase
MVFPTDRGRPPTIMGSHLGLQPGETATERSLRLMSAVGDLEQQLDAMGQQNAELNQHLKQREAQLLLAIREIKSARKEVSSARDELEHLRQQVKLLQDKVHDADRDNAALLQTMAPLLQKLLETDTTSSDPDPQE